MTGAVSGIVLGWLMRGDAAIQQGMEQEPPSLSSSGTVRETPGTLSGKTAPDAPATPGDDPLLPLLRLLSEADTAAAPGMPALLSAAGRMRGVVPFLAQYWAELDAPHMFRVLKSETGARPLSRDPAVTKALFDTWLKKDRDAAIAALDDGTALPEMARLRSNLVRDLLHTDPERALRQIARWRLNLHYNDMDGVAVWAARDPVAAANASAKVPLPGVSEHLLIEVAKVWRNSDPVAAMQWAAAHAAQFPESPAAATVAHIARLPWDKYDGVRASAFADTITDPVIRLRMGLDR